MQRRKQIKAPIKSKHGKGGTPLFKLKTIPADKQGSTAATKKLPKPIEPSKKKNNLYTPEKFSLGVEKVHTPALNRNMTNKSAFDTLYEEVMDNPDDLGTETDDLAALDVDMDTPDEDTLGGGDEVTITLPRDLAQQLHDALMGQLDAEMGEPSEEELGADDLGADIGGEEDESALPESVVVEPEPKELKHTVNDGKGSKMKVALNKSGGKAAQTGATIKLQSEPKAFNPTVNDGKGSKMKVNSSISPGKSLFD